MDFGPVPAGLQTPCVLVDGQRLGENIARVAAIARNHGVALRPHIKTHKNIEIARMQMAAGACGVTASKTDEAMVFIRAGVPSVTCAYPVVQDQQLDRLLTTARDYGCDLRCMVDSMTGIKALRAATRRLTMELPVFLKIDVGLHRCGLIEDDPRLVPFAQAIAGVPQLQLQGILSHAGQAYGAGSTEEVRGVAAEEAAIMRRVKTLLEADGLPVPEVSVGSTPTVLAADDFEGITEIRPGNYVFMDRTPVRLGLCDESQVSLTVLATVISRNKDWLIIDAGSKTLSSDGGAHGSSGAGGYGLVYPVEQDGGLSAPLVVGKLSEEHGWVERTGVDLEVGTRVRVLPNHSCVVANLCGRFWVVGEKGMVVA